jgi:hypothetical protein
VANFRVRGPQSSRNGDIRPINVDESKGPSMYDPNKNRMYCGTDKILFSVRNKARRAVEFVLGTTALVVAGAFASYVTVSHMTSNPSGAITFAARTGSVLGAVLVFQSIDAARNLRDEYVTDRSVRAWRNDRRDAYGSFAAADVAAVYVRLETTKRRPTCVIEMLLTDNRNIQIQKSRRRSADRTLVEEAAERCAEILGLETSAPRSTPMSLTTLVSLDDERAELVRVRNRRLAT